MAAKFGPAGPILAAKVVREDQFWQTFLAKLVRPDRFWCDSPLTFILTEGLQNILHGVSGQRRCVLVPCGRAQVDACTYRHEGFMIAAELTFNMPTAGILLATIYSEVHNYSAGIIKLQTTN